MTATPISAIKCKTSVTALEDDNNDGFMLVANGNSTNIKISDRLKILEIEGVQFDVDITQGENNSFLALQLEIKDDRSTNHIWINALNVWVVGDDKKEQMFDLLNSEHAWAIPIDMLATALHKRPEGDLFALGSEVLAKKLINSIKDQTLQERLKEACQDSYKFGEVVLLNLYRLLFVTRRNYFDTARTYFKDITKQDPGDGCLHYNRLLKMMDICTDLNNKDIELQKYILRPFTDHENKRLQDIAKQYVKTQLVSDESKMSCKAMVENLYKIALEERRSATILNPSSSTSTSKEKQSSTIAMVASSNTSDDTIEDQVKHLFNLTKVIAGHVKQIYKVISDYKSSNNNKLSVMSDTIDHLVNGDGSESGNKTSSSSRPEFFNYKPKPEFVCGIRFGDDVYHWNSKLFNNYGGWCKTYIPPGFTSENRNAFANDWCDEVKEEFLILKKRSRGNAYSDNGNPRRRRRTNDNNGNQNDYRNKNGGRGRGNGNSNSKSIAADNHMKHLNGLIASFPSNKK